MVTERLWSEATVEAVHDAAGSAAPMFDYLTHLGDGAVLLVAGVLIYWFGAEGTRRNRAFVIAVGTAALALSAGLKGVVQLPRPELAFSPGGYPGYTFPSAHAMGSAAFYGALAVTMKRGRPWIRYLVAGTVICVVAASRVVMGVHYPGDVIVGAGLGLALVAVGAWFREEGLFHPGPLFVLAALIAGAAALLGSEVFLALTLGASVGGSVGWYAVRDRETTDVGAAVLVLGAVGVAGILTLRGITAVLGVSPPSATPDAGLFLAEVVGYGLLTAGVLAVPALAVHVEDRPVVRWLQATLPFRGRVVQPEESAMADGSGRNRD